jgi:hypothetical protein
MRDVAELEDAPIEMSGLPKALNDTTSGFRNAH